MNDNIDSEFGPQPWTGLPAPLRPLPGETLEAFEGFVCYFNLGHERTLRLVAKKLDASIDTLKEWSSKFDWIARIKAYETQLFGKCVAAQTRSAEEQAVAKFNAQAQFRQKLASISEMNITHGQNIINYNMVHKPGSLTLEQGVSLVKLGMDAAKVEMHSIGNDAPEEQEKGSIRLDLREAYKKLKFPDQPEPPPQDAAGTNGSGSLPPPPNPA
ncbi:MAG TPA: hypothetical protein VMZ27_16930 [Candidatus Saccharimonadales bacterium]|nr:hypothetical protein [Candidatus Saccharimonadales bacterium]